MCARVYVLTLLMYAIVPRFSLILYSCIEIHRSILIYIIWHILLLQFDSLTYLCALLVSLFPLLYSLDSLALLHYSITFVSRSDYYAIQIVMSKRHFSQRVYNSQQIWKFFFTILFRLTGFLAGWGCVQLRQTEIQIFLMSKICIRSRFYHYCYKNACL